VGQCDPGRAGEVDLLDVEGAEGFPHLSQGQAAPPLQVGDGGRPEGVEPAPGELHASLVGAGPGLIPG